MSDSLAIFNSLRQGQIEEPIVAVGFSLGSGVAAISLGIGRLQD